MALIIKAARSVLVLVVSDRPDSDVMMQRAAVMMNVLRRIIMLEMWNFGFEVVQK